MKLTKYLGGKIQDCYHIKEDEYGYFWTDEMFEPVITNFDKVKEELKIEVYGWTSEVCRAIRKVKGKLNCDDRDCSECAKWLKQPYEEHKEILDEKEKEYLSFVIKPFRDRVEYIQKVYDAIGYYIRIKVSEDAIVFPYFKKDAMYEGMEVRKKYTLEELGL